MYLQLDAYPPYSVKKSDIFETHINRNLICINRYTNYVEQNEFIKWVLIIICKMFLSEFPHAKTIPCPRKIICNTWEQINVSDDILNAARRLCLYRAIFKSCPYRYR